MCMCMCVCTLSQTTDLHFVGKVHQKILIHNTIRGREKRKNVRNKVTLIVRELDITKYYIDNVIYDKRKRDRGRG